MKWVKAKRLYMSQMYYSAQAQSFLMGVSLTRHRWTTDLSRDKDGRSSSVYSRVPSQYYNFDVRNIGKHNSRNWPNKPWLY